MTTFEFPLTNTTSYSMQGTLLHDEQSAFQHIQVILNPEHRKVLVLDGNVMLSQRDQAMYHELLVMPASLLRPQATKALVIGGGDGFTAKYLLDQGFSHIDVVEIDQQVAKVSEQYFEEVSEVFNHPKVHWHFEDATHFLPSCKEGYDFIALDLTDPENDTDIVHPLYTEAFLKAALHRLRSNGIIVIQAGCPYNNPDHYSLMRHLMKRHCYHTISMGHYIPCYGEHQYFILGSNREMNLHSDEAQEYMSELLTRRGGSEVYEPLAPTIWTGVSKKLKKMY